MHTQTVSRTCAGLTPCGLLVLTVVALLGCTGCTGARGEPVFTIAIHTFARKGNSAGGRTKAVTNYEGSARRYVHAFPVITSRNILKAAFIENEADSRQHTVRFYLDKHAARCWEQLCHQEGGGKCAVLVDGFFRFPACLPRRPKNFSVMDIVGPWEPVEGQHVADEAANNRELTGFRPIHSGR